MYVCKYSRGKAVAANRGPPTQCDCDVTSTRSLRHEKSPYATPPFYLFYFTFRCLDVRATEIKF